MMLEAGKALATRAAVRVEHCPNMESLLLPMTKGLSHRIKVTRNGNKRTPLHYKG